MFDHVGFIVADFPRTRDFYTAALAPLGIAVLTDGEDWAMFGGTAAGKLWIGAAAGPPGGPVHVAIAAPSRQAVREFHTAGLAAGGRDNGAPGLRPEYRPNYYAAFLLDPDGNNIEAVTFAD
jgi:catechol 2,3-dioxygenase-like lactoylglutathione lyase family enzyme